jgi:hypothetical protein
MDNSFSFIEIGDSSTPCSEQSVFIENEIYEKGVEAKLILRIFWEL